MVCLVINSVLESKKYNSNAHLSVVMKINWHNIDKALRHTALKIVTVQKVTRGNIVGPERPEALLGYINWRAASRKAAGGPSQLVSLRLEYCMWSEDHRTVRRTREGQRIRTRLEKCLKNMSYEKWLKKPGVLRPNKNERAFKKPQDLRVSRDVSL